MADGNVVDSLELEIQATAKDAIDKLSKLETRLRGLASATKNLSGSASAISRLASSMNALKDVKVPSFRKLNNIQVSADAATNLQSVSKSLASLNGVNFKGTTFTPLIKGIEGLGKVKIDPALGANLGQITQGLLPLNGINFKGTSFTPLVNAITKLSNVKIDPASLGSISKMATELSAFGKVPDVSANVTRLVTALAKLASTGSSISTVQAELPNFASAIRKVATTLSQLGGVNPQITSFVSSIAQLASVGAKMPEAATNLQILTTSLENMFRSIGNQSVNQDVALLTSSIAQLATSLSGIGGRTGKGVSEQTSAMGKSFQKLGDIVSKVMKKITSLFKKVGSGIVSISKTIISNITGIGKASNSMFTVADGIKSVIGGLIGMRGITGAFNWLKEAVTAGADLTEIDHIIKSVFSSDSVDDVNEWANAAIESFGIASASAKRYAGVLTSMFQASNVGVKESGQMAMNLVGLAGDLSAFYNIDTETAYEKIKSGMAGMVRPLRDLGIDLSVATLNEYALSQGIGKTVTQMTQAEKVMLRYNYLMSVTTTQQGDFRRTADSFANVLRTVSAYAKAVATQIGVGLAAALRHVLILLRAVLKAALQLAQGFANLMESIFGKYEGGASGIAMDLSGADDYASDLADSATDASGGLSNASTAAEKLKKDLSVLPFDELNQLNKDSEKLSDTGGDSGLGDLGLGGLEDIGDIGDLEDAINNSHVPEAIEKWGNRIKNAFMAQNWFALGRDIAQMLNHGLEQIYALLDPANVEEKVVPFITAFCATVNSLIDQLNFELIGAVIGRGLNDITLIFNTWYENMNFTRLGQQIAAGINGLVKEADFIQLGQAIGNYFMIAWDVLAGVVERLPWANIGRAIADGLRGLVSSISGSEIGNTCAQLANGIARTIASFASFAPWNEVVDNIVNGINTFLSNFKWRQNGDALGKFINRLFAALKILVTEIHWDEFGSGVANGIMSAIRGINMANVGGAISGFIHGLFDMFNSFLTTMNWLEFGNKVGELIKGIDWSTIISDIITFIFNAAMGLQLTLWGLLDSTFIQPIKEYFGGKIEEWQSIGGDLTDGFLTGIADGLLGIQLWIYKTIFKPFIDAFKAWFGISSPSTVMMEQGGYIMEGLLRGLEAGMEAVQLFVTGLPGKFIDWLGEPSSLLIVPGASIIGSLAQGMTSNEKEPNAVVDRVVNHVKEKFGIAEEEASPSGSKTMENYGRGMQNTNTLTSAVNTAVSTVQSKLQEMSGVAPTIGNSTIYGYGRAFENRAELTNQMNSTSNELNRSFDSIRKAAEDIGTSTKRGILYGLDTHLSSLKNTTNDMVNTVQNTANSVRNAMSIDLSREGAMAGDSFARGFSSIHIPTPYMYVSGYDVMSFGDSWQYFPRFSVGWYKAGGYFTGGDGQLIGIAEGGKDEAVLPLEDKRAMSRIAESIVNANSGMGMGISKEDIVEGVVQAVLMTQGNQRDQILHVEVKTENDEVLARAVTRGLQSIDYRNNPTPQTAY